jgi:phosphoribosyl 1,2-cyclic phosphodiesterase
MQLTFWGVRGSIPSPGPQTVKYGGNTTCLEIRSDAGERIILDAGSGVRALGLELARSMPVNCSLFITHTHWDHIHGLPFFIPLFVPGNRLDIYGAADPVSMGSVKDVLSVQLEYRYFPVREAELKAEITTSTLREGQPIRIGDATITPILLNHPVLNFGYKIVCNGKSLFFTGDHERYYNIYSPEEEDFEEYEKAVNEKQAAFVEFLRDVDVLVADAQYTSEEYKGKVGWGHSTYAQSVALAKAAGVPRLFLTHHDPTRGDDALDAILERLRREHAGPDFDLDFAREGVCVEI